MNDTQWQALRAVIRGEKVTPLPVAFIIDSPWLPNWAGMTILDYYTSEERWLAANLKAIEDFPECIFLPGFWSEYGMCTEPSAFGAKCLFYDNEFPFAEKLIESADDIERLAKPDPRRDGLLPFVIKRLKHSLPRIEAAGHSVRFAVSRGPLNIASFLMGTTDFLMEMKVNPDKIHRLLRLITDFTADWLAYQRECFPTIDGVLLLDDIVGFIGEEDYREFAQPYLKELFTGLGVSVRFFHNDSPCRASAPHLHDTGINLYNMGIDVTLKDLQSWTDGKVVLMGNVPPRDVLAAGTPADVERAVEEQLRSLLDTRRILFSCGGGMPPNAPTENIRALVSTVMRDAA
ncbi:MAG: uroporphyrinogen decarboxylase [candidate division NC10 bacterium]|jgi:uroporphyrinogen decarboxylase|nr:uroporphyrinogen decarboxylase [candidate division NC10 bacterium]